MNKEKELKERIENYIWKLFTGQELTIEDIGGYRSGGIKNGRR